MRIKLTAVIFQVLFLAPVAGSVAHGQTSEEILEDRSSLQYCECGFGTKIRRTYAHPKTRKDQLARVVRCTECDLLANDSIQIGAKLRQDSVPDSGSYDEFKKRIVILLESFPTEIAVLEKEALHRTSLGKNYSREQYDLCLLSYLAVAKQRSKLPELAELKQVDCTSFPQVLRTKDGTSPEYILFVPVGDGDFRKPHIAFKSIVSEPKVHSSPLKYQWYDPYKQQLSDVYKLDMTQSLYQWNESQKTINFSSSDPNAPCHEFYTVYSLPPPSSSEKLTLEESSWVYGCATPDSICHVPLYDRSKNFRGQLIKGKPSCDQPNS